MGRKIMVIFLIFSSYIIFAQDNFLCIEEQIVIRSEPNDESSQIGILNLYDMANILEKTENISIINGREEYWYKINFNNIEGYIFGGYGIILKEQYIIRSIDDFANSLPPLFYIRETRRYLFVRDRNPVVTILYTITFIDHQFLFFLHYRLVSGFDKDYISQKYNLIIDSTGYSNYMGNDQLIDVNRSLEIITNHGNQGRYFFSAWGTGMSYDIATFLFETEIDNNFNAIRFQFFNLWLNRRDFGTIGRINANFINEAKRNRIKEAILFHIIYEIILRVKIE